jgi:uncharacterized protein YciI
VEAVENEKQAAEAALEATRNDAAAAARGYETTIATLETDAREAAAATLAGATSDSVTALPGGLKWFVKTETFVTTKSFPEIKPHLAAHKDWVASLRADGATRITSGYRVDENDKPGGGGLLLFAAPDYAAALALVEQDPLVANACVDWQLNRWIAEVGNIALVDGGTWYGK